MSERIGSSLRCMVEFAACPVGRIGSQTFDSLMNQREMAGRFVRQLRPVFFRGLTGFFIETSGSCGDGLLYQHLQPSPCFLLKPFRTATYRFGGGMSGARTACIQLFVPLIQSFFAHGSYIVAHFE